MTNVGTGLHYPIDLKSLPATWECSYLGTLTETVQSGFACGKHNSDANGVPHVRPMNISREGRIDLTDLRFVPADHDDRRLQEGDVLFNNTNSPDLIGKTAYVGRDAAGLAFSNHMTRIRFLPVVDPRFGAIQLHHLWSMRYFLHRCVKHVNQASMSSTDLGKSVPIVIPPLSEQRRIVAKIEELFSELDKGTEALIAVREQLPAYWQAVLRDAFEGKVTAGWRSAHREVVASAQELEATLRTGRTSEVRRASGRELNGMPEIPHQWAYFRVASLCSVVRGGSPRPAGDPKYYGGSIPFLKVADLTRATGMRLSSHTFTITDAGLSKTRITPPNTLLISNSGATLGVPKICTFETTFNDGIAAFLELPESYLEYFYFFWESKTRALRGIDQGAAQPNLNTSILGETLIPMCSEEEAKELVIMLEATLAAIEHLSTEIAQRLEQTNALRRAILAKAFSGQLVAQNPKDEPAYVLLQRICGERNDATRNRERTTKNGRKKAA